MSIDPAVKILFCLNIMAYGVSPSAFQDYFQMGLTTARECFIKFTDLMSSSNNTLSSMYLRGMTRDDAYKLHLLHLEKHGIQGMVGSLDCMHVAWKNCPVAGQGQYRGKEKKPTVVLEAVADHHLWIWHSTFGYAGTLNDINIWDQSPLMQSFLDGTFPDFEFESVRTVAGVESKRHRTSFWCFATEVPNHQTSYGIMVHSADAQHNDDKHSVAQHDGGASCTQ
jgi:hypothetical protein